MGVIYAPGPVNVHPTVIAAAAAAGVIGFLIGRRRRNTPAAMLADDLQAVLARLLS